MYKKLKTIEDPYNPSLPPEFYTLTDTKLIACHGTSFPTMKAAMDYAKELYNEFGLCESFSIGCYKNGKYVEVYNSKNGSYINWDSLDKMT